MDNEWWSALRWGDFVMVENLLHQELSNVHVATDWGLKGLSFASSLGYVEIMKVLFDNGSCVDEQDEDLWTPLIYACSNGQVEAVKFLLHFGARVDVKCRANWTPLMRACNKGHTEIAIILIHSGVNLNVVDDFGWTALTHAAYNKHEETALLLLQSGVDVNDLFESQFMLNQNVIKTWINEHLDALSPKNLKLWKKYRLQDIFT